MTNRRLGTASLLIAVALSAAALVHWCVYGEPVAGRRLVPSRSESCRSGPAYPEIRGPASLLVDLVEGVAAGTSVTIRVTGTLTIPVSSGLLTLRVPEIAGEPNRTDVLWTTAISNAVEKTVLYSAGPLPVGQHCFVAILEFTPAQEDAQEIAISQCLYLDVRPTAILSSNVSFEQIKRVELRQELEQRILAGLKPKLAIASDEVLARERARLEAVDPGFMDRAIQDLIATDPDAARRAGGLNERMAVTPAAGAGL